MYLQKQDQRFDRLGGRKDLEDGLESSREPKGPEGLERPGGGWSGRSGRSGKFRRSKRSRSGKSFRKVSGIQKVWGSGGPESLGS